MLAPRLARRTGASLCLLALLAGCRDETSPFASGSNGSNGSNGSGGSEAPGGGGPGGAGGDGAQGGGGSPSTGSPGGTGAGTPGTGGGTQLIDSDALWPAPGCDASPAPSVTKVGTAPAGSRPPLVLKGHVVTPDQRFDGEVLVVGAKITCAAASCSGAADYAKATVVDTKGLIFPGLIDTHNHVLFNVFDTDDWTPSQVYEDHDQWPNEERYGAMVDAKQWLNGEGHDEIELGCEMNKWGELKHMMGGTTSMVGSAVPSSSCYGSLSRTLDASSNDLGEDRIQAATLFPGKSAADAVCANLADGDTKAYLIHIAEGVNAKALNEFTKLANATTTPECLLSDKTAIVHGTALTKAEFEKMAAKKMGLVWSPRSNVFLYGDMRDATKTTDIPLVRSLGIPVALAPDWGLGGSPNMLEELRFADAVDARAWGDVLTPEDLVRMATVEAAKIAGFSDLIGSIAPGKMADLLVIEGDKADPFGSMLRARPENVRLVLVGGAPLLGDSRLDDVIVDGTLCEPIQVCCAAKFACVAEKEGDAKNKFAQSLSDIQTLLTAGLEQYDAKNLTQWKFAPLAPLVECK